MPSTLRRSRRRDLALTRSFTNAIRDKVHPDQTNAHLSRFHAEIKDHRKLLTDRTNVRSCPQLAPSKFDDGSSMISTSHPSMVFSLYRSPHPTMPHHPIHRLPLELLMHVFALGSFDDVMFPVLVSHICHSWRAVAIHTQTLWRRIVLTQHSDLIMWQERLRRARSCTLDVVLASHRSSREPHDIDVLALQMHLLAPHLARMRSIDIRIDGYTPYLWNIILGPLCRNSYHCAPGTSDPHSSEGLFAPRLESMSLRYPWNDDTKEFSLFDGLSPRLSRLTIQGVRLTWLPGLFGSLRCLDYTHHGFTSGRTAVDEILSILQVSCQLRELKLCLASNVMETEILYIREKPVVEETVTLQFLETLSLGVEGADAEVPTDLISIVSQLSLPALRKLDLSDHGLAICSPNHNAVQFAELPTFFDTICERAHWGDVMDLSVEGRWVELPLIIGLGRSFSSLRTITVNGIARNLGFDNEMT